MCSCSLSQLGTVVTAAWRLQAIIPSGSAFAAITKEGLGYGRIPQNSPTKSLASQAKLSAGEIQKLGADRWPRQTARERERRSRRKKFLGHFRYRTLPPLTLPCPAHEAGAPRADAALPATCHWTLKFPGDLNTGGSWFAEAV